MNDQWPDPRQQLQPWQQQGYPQQVHPRSPAAALVMSLFIPGLGSMYAGKPGWGILILVLWLASWVMLLAVVGLVTLPACWIWGMIAGYSDARAWNRARGIDS